MELKDHKLFFEAMGRRFRLTAIFHSDAEANAHMEANAGQAVIASVGPYVLIADKFDSGVPV
jgi:hypothetical protein